MKTNDNPNDPRELIHRINTIRHRLTSGDATFYCRTRYPAWAILKRRRQADPMPRSGLRFPRGLKLPLDSELQLKSGVFEASYCLFEVGSWSLSESPGQVAGSGFGDLLPPLVWIGSEVDVSDSHLFFVGDIDGIIQAVLLMRPYRGRPEMFLKRVHYFDGTALQGGAGVLGLIDRQQRWFFWLEGIDNDRMTAHFAGSRSHCRQLRHFYESAAATQVGP